MNLYELTEQFRALRDMEADIDADVFADTMEDIQASLDEKVDAYHAILTEWSGKLVAIDEEMRRLRNMKHAIENRRALLNENLMICMQMMGEREHKTELNRVRIQANPVRVVLDVEPADLPLEFVKLVDPEPDKKKLMAAIKLGRDLSGLAHLEQTEGVRWT